MLGGKGRLEQLQYFFVLSAVSRFAHGQRAIKTMDVGKQGSLHPSP